MITHAPPNLLHITIYITGKRQANERPVLEGFVTDDRRSPAPRDGHEKDDQSRRPSSFTSGSVKTKIQHEAHVVLRSGRPDFEELVEREVQATEYSEWLAIGACGPAPMKSTFPSLFESLRRTRNTDSSFWYLDSFSVPRSPTLSRLPSVPPRFCAEKSVGPSRSRSRNSAGRTRVTQP